MNMMRVWVGCRSNLLTNWLYSSWVGGSGLEALGAGVAVFGTFAGGMPEPESGSGLFLGSGGRAGGSGRSGFAAGSRSPQGGFSAGFLGSRGGWRGSRGSFGGSGRGAGAGALFGVEGAAGRFGGGPAGSRGVAKGLAPAFRAGSFTCLVVTREAAFVGRASEG